MLLVFDVNTSASSDGKKYMHNVLGALWDLVRSEHTQHVLWFEHPQRGPFEHPQHGLPSNTRNNSLCPWCHHGAMVLVTLGVRTKDHVAGVGTKEHVAGVRTEY